jgi:PAS domain-containing protein
MREADPNDGVVILDSNRRYVDANRRALELLGVSLEELRASAPGVFAVGSLDDAELASLRDAWTGHGGHPLAGTASLRRADGTRIRVAYVFEADGYGFRARLRQIDADVDAPATVFTVDDVLREWRAAERELAALEPGTEESRGVQREIDLLRAQYRDLFRAAETT